MGNAYALGWGAYLQLDMTSMMKEPPRAVYCRQICSEAVFTCNLHAARRLRRDPVPKFFGQLALLHCQGGASGPSRAALQCEPCQDPEDDGRSRAPWL